jgi:single-strand DNA-binding protein
MNDLTLSGRLTADPEVRYTQTGKAIAEFTLAVDRGFGENKKTSFIRCTAWEKTAETIGNTVNKGRKILVKGEWDQQRWEKDGQKHTKDYCLVRTFEYMDSKKDGESSGSASKPAPTESGYDVGSFGTEVFPEEEIPF